MINVITFAIGTTQTFYTKETITIEFLKKFLNKVEPTLDVKICEDHNSTWLEVECEVWAAKQDGWSLEPCHEKHLNWKPIAEILV